MAVEGFDPSNTPLAGEEDSTADPDSGLNNQTKFYLSTKALVTVSSYSFSTSVTPGVIIR